MTTSPAPCFAVLALLCALGAGTAAFADEGSFSVAGRRYAEAPTLEWNLPEVLRELSGFATDEHGRLFAHNDEVAIIHQVDYAAGGIVKSFALGSPAVPGDFEGITIVDGRFCLATSDGTLLLAPEGGAGDHLAFERIDTGIGKLCEVEGIEYAATEDLLYFACKSPRAPALAGRITVVAWSLTRRTEVPERTLSINLAEVAGFSGDLAQKGVLQPSAIAIAPGGRDLVLTAAKHRALITISRDGATASAIRLPKSKDMQQIEALAFGSDGTLLVGSEGKNRGRMRVYHATD